MYLNFKKLTALCKLIFTPHLTLPQNQRESDRDISFQQKTVQSRSVSPPHSSRCWISYKGSLKVYVCLLEMTRILEEWSLLPGYNTEYQMCFSLKQSTEKMKELKWITRCSWQVFLVWQHKHFSWAQKSFLKCLSLLGWQDELCLHVVKVISLAKHKPEKFLHKQT